MLQRILISETVLATVSHQPAERLDKSAKLSSLSEATLDSPPKVPNYQSLLQINKCNMQDQVRVCFSHCCSQITNSFDGLAHGSHKTLVTTDVLTVASW